MIIDTKYTILKLIHFKKNAAKSDIIEDNVARYDKITQLFVYIHIFAVYIHIKV
jgi:hypothetical protein